MFRKFIIAAAATVSLGAAALVPTTASAGWHGGHGGHFHGHWGGGRGWGGRGWGGGPYVGIGFYGDSGYGGCGLRKQQVWTRNGWCWRWVRVCYY